MILWSVHSSLWQNCEENLVGGSVGLAIHVHIKKSHNFAVKKGRVAHILVPFMVGAICGLALADPNLDSNQEKNTYEIVTLTTISKMYFFLQNGSEIGTSSVLEFGPN